MVVIKLEDQYKAAEIMSRYNAKLIMQRVTINGQQYLVLDSGPSAALLEIYVNFGIREINGKSII